jgi:SAM-dependent methyltransferase
MVLVPILRTAIVASTHATDEQIFRELRDLARTDPALAQFPSLVGGHQYLRLYQLFRRYVPVGAEVLDWGVGNGHFSYFLVRAGYRASGYSLETQTAPAWLDDPDYRFEPGTVADPVTIPFPDESFDAVASIGVLEHVRETGGSEPASLREIRRVLRPGGVFVCFHLPNRYSLIDVLARVFPVHHHEYRYTRRDIAKLLDETALELCEVRRYAILPRNQLRRLPPTARRSEALASIYDGADELLGRLFAPLCTNYYFVARRPQVSG